jgi:hypothetical protein
MVPAMARTVVRLRRDGVPRIARIERWRGVWLVVGGMFVVPPLLLSLIFVLPPAVLALPPMTLALGVWILFRRLDTSDGWGSRAAARPGAVIRLNAARRQGP